MSGMFNRRQFIQGTAAAAATVGLSSLKAVAGKSTPSNRQNIEALVIGSGFGGGVASLRLGQAGIETIVLERGRRWDITENGTTFSPYDTPDGRASFLLPTTLYFQQASIELYTGVLNGIIGNGVSVLNAAGVGGTSLIYGGITYQPPKELFQQVFPSSISYFELNSVYYPRVRSTLKASPIPDDILKSPYFFSSYLLQQQAAKAGFKTRKIDIAFDWNIVRQEIAGTKVPSVIAGQYYYGVESGAKNSVDRTYLKKAEATGNVKIHPLHVVTSIQELDGPRYQVIANQINTKGEVIAQKIFVCRYLFLAAGSIGTTELLLRAKAEGTLPLLNNQVGKFWGTNGDSTTPIINNGRTNPNQGTPGVLAIEHFNNPIAPVMLEPFPLSATPEGVNVALGQGITKPEGYLTYNRSTKSADLFWPANSPNNQKITRALEQTYQILNQANGTTLATAPNFTATAHPLGGATMGRVCTTYGQVLGYPNMFVVDGALMPGSTACVNPSLTIAALAERSLDRFLNNNPQSR